MSAPPPTAPSTIIAIARRTRAFRRAVVLTGAGISASAGLPTYRGKGGLWNKDPELARLLVAGVDPSVVWGALGPFRTDVRRAEPTPAHHALASFEDDMARAGGTVTIITQNIDGLHQRSGSKNVVELHGNLHRTRCSNDACDLPPFDDEEPHTSAPPCPRCGGKLRLAIVLFEEALGPDEEMSAKHALRECDLFVAIGTSGTVWPAANFVRSAAYEGAHTICVNLGPLPGEESEAMNPAFAEVILGAADDVIPALLAR